MFADNKEYKKIIEDILENKEFEKLKKIEHHGTTRYDHSFRVSYYSYLVAKKLNLKYEETARAGLLHDFFLSPEDRTTTHRVISTFVHPKYALKTASEHFELSKVEQNIIRSHMFPINIWLPKYKESWLVSTVDKVIGTYEFGLKIKNNFKYKFSYTVNLLFLILISKF